MIFSRARVCVCQIGWLRSANAISRKYRPYELVTGETFAALAACHMARREYRTANAVACAGVEWYAANAPDAGEDGDLEATSCSSTLLTLLARVSVAPSRRPPPRPDGGTRRSRRPVPPPDPRTYANVGRVAFWIDVAVWATKRAS